MSNNLFVYGTLLFDEVWNEIVGSSRNKKLAKAHGWTRYYINNKLYPGLRYSEDSVVEGLLINDLTQQHWSKLDKFEDDLYTRKLIEVILENNTRVRCHAYIVEQTAYKYLSSVPWEPEKFKQVELEKFMCELKARTSAK